MKILFLNPHIDAQHKVVQALKARGMALLMPSNAEEAWQVLKLHGTSLDLAILHREGLKGGDPGVELLYKIKRDPEQSDLPVIFTTETWSPEQCANHQQTSMGANAYLCWPFNEKDLLNTVDAIFGSEPEQVAPPAPFAEAADLAAPQAPTLEPPTSGEFVLEDPSKFMGKSEAPGASIQLDAPEAASPVLEENSGITINAGAIAPGSLELSSDPSSIELSSPESSAAEPEAPGADLSFPQIQMSEAPASEAQIPEALVVDPQVVEPEAITPQAAEPQSDLQDSELRNEMPYLFGGPDPKADPSKSMSLNPVDVLRAIFQPVGDAVVPGGAAQAPDMETMKKYLLLREQDVAALSAQLKAAHDELSSVKTKFAHAQQQAEGLQLTVQDQNRKIEDFEREKELALQGVQAELQELRFQSKAKADKAKLLEGQVKEATNEIERLKERVRSDIRKIRVRERELENKLELTKKDSEAILSARENKIIELKRKLDLLEFNMDLLQDRYNRERENSAKLREKLAKAAQVVRVAEGLLEEPAAAAASSGGPEETKAS